LYLGIDLGTSEPKVVLLDERHRIAGASRAALTTSRPHPLWSEQEPADWWTALDAAMLQLRRTCPEMLASVRAIGLSGQMHGAVPLDAGDHVLRPAILWNDGRSGAECAALEAGGPALRSIAANAAMPGFTAPKLLWMRTHEPERFARTACVLLPKDWLRLGLIGERVSDLSDASGTWWLDVRGRRWSDELLAATHLTRAQMPRLVEGSAVSGRLRPAVAERWGLRAATTVAGGGGDNAASAVGVGAVRPAEGFISLGTSGVIFLATDACRPDPDAGVHAFCHALPDRWHQMTVMLSAASALRWIRGILGLPSESALLEGIARLGSAQRARAPLFLPYLSGERTPHNDPDAEGVFFGLRHEHGPDAIGYAVLEGVSFALFDGWRSLAVAPGAVTDLSLVGGGAQSELWAQTLASLLDVPLKAHEEGGASAALGAARLAWLADGGDPRDVCRAPAVTREFTPDSAEAALLQPRYERFRRLYPALREEFGGAQASLP
jgi:xylulokinase